MWNKALPILIPATVGVLLNAFLLYAFAYDSLFFSSTVLNFFAMFFLFTGFAVSLAFKIHPSKSRRELFKYLVILFTPIIPYFIFSQFTVKVTVDEHILISAYKKEGQVITLYSNEISGVLSEDLKSIEYKSILKQLRNESNTCYVDFFNSVHTEKRIAKRIYCETEVDKDGFFYLNNET